jgi:hypothetical protein
MCCQDAKRIVTHLWGSVVRWTRGNWLGSRPSAEDMPEKPRPFMGRGVSRSIRLDWWTRYLRDRLSSPCLESKGMTAAWPQGHERPLPVSACTWLCQKRGADPLHCANLQQ